MKRRVRKTRSPRRIRRSKKSKIFPLGEKGSTSVEPFLCIIAYHTSIKQKVLAPCASYAIIGGYRFAAYHEQRLGGRQRKGEG